VKRYSSTITLTKNSRGIWDLDTVKGCKYGSALNKDGCYGACYAAAIAKRYKIDFSKSVLRRFDSKSHLREIIKQIELIDMPFVRIGVSGDPSECWGHTIDICNKIKPAGKQIVIITKHWEPIPEYLLKEVSRLELIINTSISALDTDSQINHRLYQYNQIKNVCKSVLRIVSCDFNKNNIAGLMCHRIQNQLFLNKTVIDTVLRIPENHFLVVNGVVNIIKNKFMSSDKYMSLFDKDAFLGYCHNCPEMCGVNL
jgi:uncharacterized protein YlzI (FlbEa/FlbD family)